MKIVYFLQFSLRSWIDFLSVVGSKIFSMVAGEVDSMLGSIMSTLESLVGMDLENLTATERLSLAQRCETIARLNAVIRNDIALSVTRCHVADLGGPAHKVLADWLRITPAEASRRIETTEPLSPRTIVSQTLAPSQPAVAEAWRRGDLDDAHVRVIQYFLKKLPHAVPDSEKDCAEAFLAEQATELRPDQLRKVADRLALTLNPDGDYSDKDRARSRGFSWGPQDLNGMSKGRLYADPELRAALDAWFAKFAAPGMCNPADQTPIVTGSPTEIAIQTDTRTTGQRQHDALTLLVRSQLGNPKLGQHNGLPVTIVATATVQDLENATGYATTGGGTRLPITDLIRMASHSIHYLALFDGAANRPLYFARAKRVATADQRLVLHATDRGCSFPGCSVPGYLTEVHHLAEWAQGGLTNIDNLSFACGGHHRLIKPGGWKTRKTALGQTEWIPPPHVRGARGGTNTFHHPENLLNKPPPKRPQ